MSLFSSAVQAAVYAALNGNVSANVYDDVPDQLPGKPEDKMPYVVIGADQAFPFETDSHIGHNYTITLSVWSAYSGKKEAKDIMDEAFDLLHRQSISVTGADTIDCLHTYSTIMSIGANNYVQGISRYRLTITEVT